MYKPVKINVRVLLVLPAPVTQEHACVAALLCIHQSRGQVAKAPRAEHSVLSSKEAWKHLMKCVKLNIAQEHPHDRTIPHNWPRSTRNKYDLAVH